MSILFFNTPLIYIRVFFKREPPSSRVESAGAFFWAAFLGVASAPGGGAGGHGWIKGFPAGLFCACGGGGLCGGEVWRLVVWVVSVMSLRGDLGENGGGGGGGSVGLRRFGTGGGGGRWGGLESAAALA